MAENKEEESSKRVIYTYPMVKQTDMPDDMKVKLLEIKTSIKYNSRLGTIHLRRRHALEGEGGPHCRCLPMLGG